MKRDNRVLKTRSFKESGKMRVQSFKIGWRFTYG